MKSICRLVKKTRWVRLCCTILLLALATSQIAAPCAAAGVWDVRCDAFYNAISGRADRLDVSGWKCDYKEVYNALSAVLDTCPELSYCVYEECRCYSYENGVADYIELAYDNDYAQTQSGLDAAVEKLTATIDSGSMEPWEIALAVHEYLTTHIHYDYARFAQGTLSQRPETYTAFGALAEGEAVCSGYSKAYQYVLTQCYGMECIVVSSQKADHAWNMVRFSANGPWYHVDVTWDDPYWDTLGRSCHNYFLLSDAQLLALDPLRDDYTTRCITPDGAPSAPVPFGGSEPFWAEVNSQCCYLQGNWYFVDRQSKQLMVYDSDTLNLRSVLELPNNTWKVWDKQGWTWPNSYSYLYSSGGYLYFNTCSDIRRYDPVTGETRVVKEVDTTNGYIYGFGECDSGVGYVIRQMPNADGPEVITPLQECLWDVESGSWYTPAVDWAVEKNIVTSGGTGRFSPHENCTRGQMVTWLWRQAGRPAPTTQCRPFRDVPPDSEYADAILWAWEKGYVNGMSADTFEPDGSCTRAQAVTILNRIYSRQFPDYSDTPYIVFQDVDYDAWYAQSVTWAFLSGLVTGMGNCTFGIDLPCSRAQRVTMLYRTDTNMARLRRVSSWDL